MALVEGSLLVAVILIIVFVLVGVYVFSSVKTLVGQIMGCAFILIALIIGLVISGII
jgi:hypothetical protein